MCSSGVVKQNKLYFTFHPTGKDSAYHDCCYTSCGALAGTRHSSLHILIFLLSVFGFFYRYILEAVQDIFKEPSERNAIQRSQVMSVVLGVVSDASYKDDVTKRHQESTDV